MWFAVISFLLHLADLEVGTRHNALGITLCNGHTRCWTAPDLYSTSFGKGI